MKKITISLIITSLAFLLSACSLSLNSTKKVTADGGIFKSTDGGENWQQKAPAIAAADMLFVTFDPQDEKITYLSMKGLGLYKSIDGGDTWQGTNYSAGTFISLATDHLNTMVIYAIRDNKIIKSVDGLTTFFDTYIETRPNQTLVTVLTDPVNSNIVYAATTTSLIKSTDYGNTWKLLSWQEPTIINLYQSKKNSSVLYTLTNKGIFKSTNGGLDWTDSNAGLSQFPGASTINWIDFDPLTEYMFIGTTDSILKSTNGAVDWEEVPTLFEFKKVPIKTVIHNPQNLLEIIFPYNSILLKTDDGGKTWKSLKSIPTNRLISYIVVNPYHPDTIFAGTTLPPPTKKK